ncbi:hypothetical protein HMPREF9120_00131 [Neisseria sp. oral taxon 020 str. F0370]|nr:hypothetical protein HMPREF9120_00131 [Neisseria sp. oral taxon 020 str. F0370]
MFFVPSGRWDAETFFQTACRQRKGRLKTEEKIPAVFCFNKTGGFRSFQTASCRQRPSETPF